MISVNVKVGNVNQLRKAFRTGPKTVTSYLQKAVQASVFEVEKEAVDRNFQFKTPRARRTGMLELSFKQGRRFSTDGLRASIGPRVRYAPYVYFGTRRGIQPNPFMDRIAKKAEPKVQKHFDTALDRAVKKVAKQAS